MWPWSAWCLAACWMIHESGFFLSFRIWFFYWQRFLLTSDEVKVNRNARILLTLFETDYSEKIVHASLPWKTFRILHIWRELYLIGRSEIVCS